MTHWHIHPLSKSLGMHTLAWDALNRQSFNTNPLLDSRFVDGLLRHFGDGSEHLCVLERNGTPAAMCVLKPKTYGIWTSFLPPQAQLGPTLIQNENILQDLMRSLPGNVARLDLLCVDAAIDNPPPPDATTPTCSRVNHALTMRIRLDTRFEDYWAARSKNLVKNIGRYQRRLATDQVACSMVCITGPNDISAAVDRYAALESAGWKGGIGTAISINTDQGGFYGELMSRFAASGDAWVYELWFDGRLVASRLVIASSNMVVILKTTYDESYAHYAPGRLLLHAALESLFANHPGKVVEFYTDANSDQLAWATHHRWITHESHYRSVFAARMFGFLRSTRQVLTSGRALPETQAGTLNVDVFRHPVEFPHDVTQFFETQEKQSIEFGVSWYQNLISAVYADHKGVRIYVLRKMGRPVAALPVIAKKTVLSQQVDSLSNYYTALYAPLIDKALKVNDLAYLLSVVRQAHTPISAMRFAPMDPTSAGFPVLFAALQEAGLVPFTFFCFGNWHLTVNEDWATYLKTRSGTLRSTIKRMTKKFETDGGRLELALGGASLDKALLAYAQVYVKSWKQEEPYPQFVPGLIRTCAELGRLRLGIAWLNDKPIAAQFWMVANGKANIYKVAYDADYKTYAPGTLLTAMLMEHAIKTDKVSEVDYLIGDDPYKKTWMSHRRERWGIVAYNPKNGVGLAGLVREVLGRSLRPVVARVKVWLAKTRGPQQTLVD